MMLCIYVVAVYYMCPKGHFNLISISIEIT